LLIKFKIGSNLGCPRLNKLGFWDSALHKDVILVNESICDIIVVLASRRTSITSIDEVNSKFSNDPGLMMIRKGHEYLTHNDVLLYS